METLLNLKTYGICMTPDAYELQGKSLRDVLDFCKHPTSPLEVYFNKETNGGVLPLELRSLGTGWYPIKETHVSEGNISYDLTLPLPDGASSVLDHIGYMWFESIRPEQKPYILL